MPLATQKQWFLWAKNIGRFYVCHENGQYSWCTEYGPYVGTRFIGDSREPAFCLAMLARALAFLKALGANAPETRSRGCSAPLAVE